MNVQCIVPLVAAVAYIPLLVMLIFASRWQKQHRLLVVYLFAAALWSFSDFFLRSDFFMEHKIILFRIVICAALLMAIQLYYFLKFLMYKSGDFEARFGYGFLIVFVSLAALGYIPESISFEGGHVAPAFGWWIILYAIVLVPVAVSLIYLLVRRYKTSDDPRERNKFALLLVGSGCFAILGLSGITPLAEQFPLSHFGGLFFSLALTYVVVKHELLTVSVFLRRGLVWLGVGVVGITAYVALFFLFSQLIGFEFNLVTVAVATGAAIVTTVLAYVAHSFFAKGMEQIFYRGSYEPRRKLLDFVGGKLSGVFSLGELSAGLLPLLVKSVGCQRAYLLLPEPGGDDFVSQFSEPPEESSSPLRIRHDSPVMVWLSRECRYLTASDLDILPEFRGLWREERDTFAALEVGLFSPLVSRENLIGILALGRKSSGSYLLEDINLVTYVTNRVAASLEKEYLQEQLKRREQELSLVNRLAGVITSSLNIQDVYEAFIAELKEGLDADWASIALIESGELYFQALSADVESAWQPGELIPLEGTGTEWVVTHKKTLVEPDLLQNSRFWTGEVHSERGIRSIVYLPLLVKDEAIGSLIVASCRPSAYSLWQVSLLERLALQIAMPVENARLYAKTEQRARVDELTTLFNRRHFDERLKAEIGRHSRYSGMLSLILLDLDHFKNYNDTQGHLAGDEVLRQVGQLLKESVRNVDMSFRYGGDEFAVILPHSSIDDAFVVAERIRERLAAAMASQQIAITASIGLASWPNDGVAPDEVINASDRALYYAKQTGGNRVYLVSKMLPSLAEPAVSKVYAEREALSIIYALAATIEARDEYTYGHSRRVSNYAVALAEVIGLPSERVAVVSTAALLHDIGKIGIPDSVLNKAGDLDPKEWELIESHPQLSATIVGHVPSLTPCLPAILHHHERWDGSGYPSGLKGKAIPVEARILSIADSFEAMTSPRPYRGPLAYKDALKELRRCAGTQFDAEMVELFLPIALATASDEIGVGQSTGNYQAD